MGKQADAFLASEGNAWWARNAGRNREFDRVIGSIANSGISPTSVLEVGCGDGDRLMRIRKLYDCAICGVDPSADAMRVFLQGRDTRGIVGTAVSLPGGRDKFDLVIFGFCLYVCDREDLFRIVAEADRVLQDGGHLVINDFFTMAPHSRGYEHFPGLRSYKMDYARLWLANPAYTIVDECIYDAEPHEAFRGEDNRYVVTVLKKDMTNAFPLKEDVCRPSAPTADIPLSTS